MELRRRRDWRDGLRGSGVDCYHFGQVGEFHERSGMQVHKICVEVVSFIAHWIPIAVRYWRVPRK